MSFCSYTSNLGNIIRPTNALDTDIYETVFVSAGSIRFQRGKKNSM
jgi:hypothetical protein